MEMIDLKQLSHESEGGIAVLAGGCFWGAEAELRFVPGVESTVVGYCGGSKANPTYEEVCTGSTGHAEAVLVRFNPNTLSYEELLQRFWGMHDYTRTLGQQQGDQYRNAIFPLTLEQQELALAAKQELEKGRASRRPVTTRIEEAAVFWPAEERHQRYYERLGVASVR